MASHSGQFMLEFIIVMIASAIFLLIPLYMITTHITSPPIHGFEKAIFGRLLR